MVIPVIVFKYKGQAIVPRTKAGGVTLFGYQLHNGSNMTKQAIVHLVLRQHEYCMQVLP
jgi:hypothetical protein